MRRAMLVAVTIAMWAAACGSDGSGTTAGTTTAGSTTAGGTTAGGTTAGGTTDGTTGTGTTDGSTTSGTTGTTGATGTTDGTTTTSTTTGTTGATTTGTTTTTAGGTTAGGTTGKSTTTGTTSTTAGGTTGKGTTTGTTGTTGSTGTTGTTGTGGTAPTLGGCTMFPADNPWNADISKYPVNSNWIAAGYIGTMHTTNSLHPDWGPTVNPGKNPDPPYGIPFNVVPSSQPFVAISFTTDKDYAGQSDPGPYPIPASPKIESPTDSHMLILQQGTCQLYETWETKKQSDGTWYANNGAKFDLTSDKLRPDGETSGDAAGLPILPGLVRWDEVSAGAIHHAIRFTMNNTYNGYIHPATHAAGLSESTYPPMGLRLRLNASVDISKFSKEAQVILTAMKTYGIILADNGDNWYIQGDTNDGWTSTVMDGVSSAFDSITGADFTAVDSGPILTTGL